MSGPPHSWTLTIPCCAASARNARWARSRWSGVIAARTAARTAWWAARVSEPSGDQPVGVAGGRGQLDQSGGDQRGVDVDAAEVDGRAAGGVVELGAAGQPRVGPGALVPAVGEQDLAGDDGVAYAGQQFGAAVDAGEVEAGQVQAGGGGVDVRVDEGGGHESALEVDDLGAGVQGTGRGVLADPDHGAAGDRHRRGVRAGGGVDAPAEQERRVFVRHALESPPGGSALGTWVKAHQQTGRFTP